MGLFCDVGALEAVEFRGFVTELVDGNVNVFATDAGGMTVEVVVVPEA